MDRRQLISGLIGSAVLLPIACVASGDPVQQDMRYFYEVFVGRPLTSDEAKNVAQDMRDFYQTEELARKSAAQFRENGDWLKDKATKYEEEVFRHRLIMANYWDDRTGVTSRRLLLEPDPPLVTAERWKGIMLRSDVIAYAQILNFQKGGAPKTPNVRDEKINALAKALNQAVREPIWIPQQYSGLRTTWIAIQAAWNKLTHDEQKAVRLYALKGFRAQFEEVKLYQKIFGEYGGATRAIEDNTEQFAASTSSILREQMVIDLMLQNFADPTPVVIAN